MEDSAGNRLEEAGPSTPVRLLGLSAVPELGATLDTVKNERGAKSIIQHRLDELRAIPVRSKPRLSLEEFYARADAAEVHDLRIVLKSDVAGTREAVRRARRVEHHRFVALLEHSRDDARQRDSSHVAFLAGGRAAGAGS